MNFKFHLTTFQMWSIVVKIALNALYRDGVDSVFSCLIPYPMEKSAEITKNERVLTRAYTFFVSRKKDMPRQCLFHCLCDAIFEDQINIAFNFMALLCYLAERVNIKMKK